MVKLGLKREVVLNGLKGPESDLEGSKIRKDPQGPFGSNLATFGQTKLLLLTLRESYECVGGKIWGLFCQNIEF